MRYDAVIVGGGTAGCVLAARLSDSPDRRVCLVEAGPDYGPLEDGRWPAEILDARALPSGHDWGTGGEDGRSLGGRVLGGSSAVNACMVVAGSPADYDEWGHGWSYEDMRPYLERAASGLRTAPSNTARPARFQSAVLAAAQAAGYPLLPDPNDASATVGVAPFPANVVGGRRWNAAFAYLDPARDRPNLTIVTETLVDRVALDRSRATGVVTADGRVLQADIVLLAAGAYFSPAILARSGVGPEAELRKRGIPIVESLPAGERLLDHCGTDVAWDLAPLLQAETYVEACGAGLFEAHAFVKAASTACERGSWDLHLLPWIYAAGAGYQTSIVVFHVKPLSTGRVRLRSTDPADPPIVERGFLTREEDLVPLVEGVGLARAIGAADPLRELLAGELSPGAADPEQYVRDTVRSYFHPAGTCPLGTVVDAHGRVFGTEGLYVADASFMPTIPRANTNLTTAAIAERIADGF